MWALSAKGSMRNISDEQALEFVSPFIGKAISRVWQGNGSAIFLEVGELTENKGELTIMIEWSWRVESFDEIIFGSFSDPSEFSENLDLLVGLTLNEISFQSRLPEVVVALSDDKWLCSFSTVEGDPEWALISPKNTLLSSKGSLGFE